jgi:hypothetical protein
MNRFQTRLVILSCTVINQYFYWGFFFSGSFSNSASSHGLLYSKADSTYSCHREMCGFRFWSFEEFWYYTFCARLHPSILYIGLSFFSVQFLVGCNKWMFGFWRPSIFIMQSVSIAFGGMIARNGTETFVYSRSQLMWNWGLVVVIT